MDGRAEKNGVGNRLTSERTVFDFFGFVTNLLEKVGHFAVETCVGKKKKNRNASLSEVYNKVDTFTGDISVA
jgi:hypothetical protein